MSVDSALLPGDDDVVVRARDGDPQAMHDLLATLRPAIARFCHFRLASYPGGGDAADDAVQETCLAVARVLPSYEDKGLPFRAWVYAIAANKVADAQRSFGRSAILVDELPEQVEPSLTPEAQAVATAELRAAMGLVERLPVRMRRVLLLRASGATAKNVADMLGMTSGAVDVAHHRALGQIREMVDASAELRELFAPFRAPASGDVGLPQVA